MILKQCCILEPGVFYPYWTLENGNINIDTSFRSNELRKKVN